MKLFTYSIFLCFLIPEILLAQQDLTSQLPKAKRYDPKEVIDEEYGINLYEKLNIRLSSDSVRNCKGYACSGWVEDYYTNGAVLHKGYYIDGQLKIYKNFYPNGNVEREYKIIDDYKSNMKKYYENGTLKSDIKYTDKDASKWEDFYDNGQVKYFEEYNKNMDYYLAQKSFFKDGTPESVFELTNKKKLVFIKKEYFSNGQVKEEGEMVYNTDLLDYRKIGKWSFYDEKGKLVKEEFYENGSLHAEKTY